MMNVARIDAGGTYIAIQTAVWARIIETYECVPLRGVRAIIRVLFDLPLFCRRGWN